MSLHISPFLTHYLKLTTSPVFPESHHIGLFTANHGERSWPVYKQFPSSHYLPVVPLPRCSFVPSFFRAVVPSYSRAPISGTHASRLYQRPGSYITTYCLLLTAYCLLLTDFCLLKSSPQCSCSSSLNSSINSLFWGISAMFLFSRRSTRWL